VDLISSAKQAADMQMKPPVDVKDKRIEIYSRPVLLLLLQLIKMMYCCQSDVIVFTRCREKCKF